MAVLDNKFRIRGTVAKHAYRVIGSKTIIQSKPGKGSVKQTRATKECGSEFALASNTARQIRLAFYPAIQGLADGGMINRLNSKVLKAISSNKQAERGMRDLHGSDLSHLENFEFNINSPLQKYLLVKPGVILDENRVLHVHVPALNTRKELKTPARHSETTIKILVIAFNFKEEFYQTCGTHDIVIPDAVRIQEAADWTCPTQMPPGCVILVSMLLQYSHRVPFMDTITCNSKELMPSAIIGAFETSDGEETEEPAYRWPLTNYRGKELVNREGEGRR